MSINGEEVIPAMHYDFENAGSYEIRFTFKHVLPSLYCLFTNQQDIEKLVNVNELDTSCVTDLCWAFDGMFDCKKIKGIERLNTENVTLMKSTFQNGSGLTQLDLTNWDVSKTESMTYMFNNCANLKVVGDLTNWDMSNVTDTRSMFSGCKSLVSVGDLTNWNMPKNTNMRYMFYECNKLQEIGDLTNWNASNVTDTYCMFYGCSGLTNIGDFSNWDMSQKTNISRMFQRCRNLETVGDLSNWNTSNVTDMSWMFYECNKLESIGDISNWDVSNVTTMAGMFQRCTSLENVGDLSKWDTSKVTDMRSMFTSAYSTSKFNNIGIPPIPKGCNAAEIFYNCYALTNIVACGKISAYLRFYNSPLTRDSALKVLNALDPENPNTLVFPGIVYDILSPEDIAIGTDKGWKVQRW